MTIVCLSLISRLLIQQSMWKFVQNPDRILEANDKIFIQGYGGPYPDYDYTVAIYDKENKTYKKLDRAH